MLQLRHAVLKVAYFEPNASLPGNLFAQATIGRHVRSYCPTAHHGCDILAAHRSTGSSNTCSATRLPQQYSTEMVHILLSPKTDCAIMCHENGLNLFNVGQRRTDMHLLRGSHRTARGPSWFGGTSPGCHCHQITKLPGTRRLGHCRVPTGPACHVP